MQDAVPARDPARPTGDGATPVPADGDADAQGEDREARRRAEEERRRAGEELRRAREATETALEALAARTRELDAGRARLAALEGELARQRAAVDEATLAKHTFLQVMSQELRTPLDAIGGYAQLLELEILGAITEPQRETIERIMRSQRQLLRLISDVLQLARIGGKRVEYAIETLPAGELVDAVLPLIEPQLAERGIACIVAVSPGLLVRADRERTEQILLNLLTNAMKFTAAGGRVVVDTTQLAQSPEKVFVRVSDTGIGIPRDRLEEVFEPFAHVDASHSRRAEGTGLGLAISRDLARGMGGDLRVRSHEGRGSIFTLTLPMG